MPPRYQVRLRDAGRAAHCFADLEVITAGEVLVVGGEFDQSALHGLLQRIRVQRLELLDLRRTRGTPPQIRGPAVTAYEIRVVGALGAAGREAFADLAVDVEPTATVLTGSLDQEGLHHVLDRVRALGLELMDVRQAPDPLWSEHPDERRP